MPYVLYGTYEHGKITQYTIYYILYTIYNKRYGSIGQKKRELPKGYFTPLTQDNSQPIGRDALISPALTLSRSGTVSCKVIIFRVMYLYGTN